MASAKINTPQGVVRTAKRHLRIERAVRLELTGKYSNDQIAQHLGIHTQTLVILKQTPEYQAKRIELTEGIISDLDRDLREDIDNNRDELRSMVPGALLGLRDLMLSKNEGIKLRAIETILDRDGNLAKVSKSSVKIEEVPDTAAADKIGNDILNLLNSYVPDSDPTAEGINIATVGGFTKTAAQSLDQSKLMDSTIDETTLAAIDSASEKIQ